MDFLYNVGLPRHDGHQWPKHVRQNNFTYLIIELVTLDAFLHIAFIMYFDMFSQYCHV
jgi:hypothetical protein